MAPPTPQNVGAEIPGVIDTPAQLAAKEASCAAQAKASSMQELWIPRHPALIPLSETRDRQMVAETPLDTLKDAGLITPAALQYVLNHGFVPKLGWDTHTLTVKTPKKCREFNMNKLKGMKGMRRQTLPVTLLPAGHRRKEVAALKPTSNGAFFGAGAAATSVWTGVPLRVLLNKCGVRKPTATAKFVHFKGPQGQTPGKGDGTYEVSIPLKLALDPAADIIVAYEQNYAPLLPDQGFPLRVVVPGYQCGRSVKWLTCITVSDKESTNYWNVYENKIMPPGADANTLSRNKTWADQDFAHLETKVTSALWAPAPDTFVKVTDDPAQTVTLQGYAIGEGGAKVTMVKVSMDSGANWLPADLTRISEPRGKSWCWVVWSLVVPAATLAASPVGAVRVQAFDAKHFSQPTNLQWNCLGNGNNSHYVVRLNTVQLPDGTSLLHFEHPTQQGLSRTGGWMGPLGTFVGSNELIKSVVMKASNVVGATPSPTAPMTVAAPAAAAKPAAKPAAAATRGPPSNGVTFTMADVEKHNTEDDCWIVVAGKVYNVDNYLKDHPGGSDSITINAGTDTTEEFEAIHSKKAWKQLDPWYIGDLVEAGAAGAPAAAAAPAAAPVVAPKAVGKEKDYLTFPEGPLALDPKKRIAFKLVKREDVSSNSRIYTYALQSPSHVWGLPVGKHVMCAANVNGKLVMRAYTPISTNEEIGQMRLLIKTYFPTEQYPQGGVMSYHMEQMQIGDMLEMKGPIGHIQYKGMGYWTNDKTEIFAKKMVMVAGGTGITPMWQFIVGGLSVPGDKTVFYLLYANISWDDILLRDELEALQKKHPDRLKIYHTLSRKQPAGWKGGTTRPTEKMLKDFFPKGKDNCSAFLCGPDGMIESASAWLQKMGYKEGHIGVF